MRTPNCNCIICNKPLYRRPFELKKVKFVCCKTCRSKAYKQMPNINSLNNLKLGHKKGENHLRGIKKSDVFKSKMKHIMKKWCNKNKELIQKRAIKTRGINHYNWKGGKTNLNQDIRTLNEMRKWQNAVKKRDGKCQNCNNKNELEAHHIISVNEMIEKYQIKNRDDARDCKEFWNIDNGITLCRECHYKLEGRTYVSNR